MGKLLDKAILVQNKLESKEFQKALWNSKKFALSISRTKKQIEGCRDKISNLKAMSITLDPAAMGAKKYADALTAATGLIVTVKEGPLYQAMQLMDIPTS